MRSTSCVDRVTPEDRSSVIVTCVHGTWASGSRWPGLEIAFGEALRDYRSITVNYFEWSGRNSVVARRQAAADLRRSLADQIAAQPDARHVLVAHSHGANVVLHALNGPPSTFALRATVDKEGGPHEQANPHDIRDSLSGIVLLSPPLLDCQLVDEPAGAANKLLLAAVALVPILLGASSYARVALGASRVAQLVGVVAVIAAWLMLFRPAAVRRRAEAIAQQVALPRLEFPGLVVRTPHDEAAFALSAASAFARIARRIWSHVLAARAPFVSRDDQQLREARTTPEINRAVFDALVMVPLSISLLSAAHTAADDGRWATLAMTLPLGMVAGTAALIVVGGSVLMLLMLPAVSLLLWPFGIGPTPASALLDVSVEQTPTPDWRVATIAEPGPLPPSPRLRWTGRGSRPTRPRPTWQHSLHEQPEALGRVTDYLRDVFETEPRTPKPNLNTNREARTQKREHEYVVHRSSLR